MIMTLLDYGTATPEHTVGVFAVIVLSGIGIWQFSRWLMRGPRKPDPWGDEVAAELEKEGATALCHRCLSPHDQLTNFCSECGAPVGDYTNLLPYPYLFSIGHTLRLGTSGEYRRSPLTVIGFLVFALVEYTFFAPLYWFVFARTLKHPLPPTEIPTAGPPAGSGASG